MVSWYLKRKRTWLERIKKCVLNESFAAFRLSEGMAVLF